ncbi:ABC transporter ATP-binding protein [Acuticoccus yangtzensis]|uniref:ABC transporter ATP-binding protein n=1 Tax=Acuticoccus yangtzensis TaxID=1443441 RepID=UPI000A838C63|nr:ABC transporter ATP-binding protein [Acuticoccus yangtzensis]
MRVLTVDDLTVSFRSERRWVQVINGVSFHIDSGETVAVVGESGSGKSVTALSIMRLLQKNVSRLSGRITLGDTELTGLSDQAMRDVRGADIGMIFQEPMTSLNPVLTAGFQVTEALRRHRGLSRGDARREALRLFDLVRIPDAARRFDQHPHTFSGGQRQRVMIAMAMACRPKLLIADEPTTALDVTIQAQILSLIADLQKEIGMAVMFITHDMGVVAEIADRVVVMLKGDKVEEGPVADVFAAPREPYTRMLLASVPRLGALGDTLTPRRFADLSAEAAAVDAAPAPPPQEPDKRGAPILTVDALTTRFAVRGGVLGRMVGKVHAVENVSFTVREGETLALVGESGCGKSTTGRSLLRLIEPASGAIRFEGRDVMAATPAEMRTVRRRMQMIFQDPFGSLNPRKTVGASIREPIMVHGLGSAAEAEARVADLLQRAGLTPEHALRFPHEFSGGQRQRVVIARGLALNPSLLVADESVSALDASVKAQVVNLLLDLQRDLGLAFVFISHDIAVVERISHRVAVMYLGEIVEIGPRASVLTSPRHPYTQKLIEAVPIADPAERQARKGLMTDEIRSAVRPLDYEPEPRRMIEVAPEHFVMEH